MTTDTTQKPLNVQAHELLTGKPCEYDDGKWVAVCKFNPYCGGWDIEDVPQYDTDWAAAGRLVEAMKKANSHVKTTSFSDGVCMCEVTSFTSRIVLVKRHASASASTMPLAITTAFIEACKPEPNLG